MTGEGANDRVFLTDFGLAKNIATGSRYTRTGETLGTPSYMSPEQARGELTELTPASDVWALGCVLYECLAGRSAFEGDTAAAVIAQLLTARPPPLRDVPRGARDLVAVCLQNAAGRRHQSASALRDDCRRVLDGQPPMARPPRRLPAAAWVAIAAGMITLAGAGLWAGRRGESAAPTPVSTQDVDAEGIAETGWALRQTDIVEAQQLLAAALSRAPHRHDWRIQLGLLQWANNDNVEDAEATWEDVPQESALWTRSRWLIGLAWAARFLGDGRESLRLRGHDAWKAAAEGRGMEAAWARAGLLMLAGKHDEARTLLGSPTDWTASLLRGLLRRGQETVADSPARIAAYTRALAGGLPFAWVYLNRGALHEGQGDLARARQDFDTAVRYQPDLAQAYYNRGNLRNAQGDVAGARADFDDAVRLRPDLVRAYYSRGLLSARQGDLDGARRDYDAVLQRLPHHAQVYNDRGLVRARQGDLAGAISDYEAALQRQPDYANAHAALAIARMKQRDWAAAVAAFQRFLDLAPPSHTLLTQARRWLVGCEAQLRAQEAAKQK